MEDSRWDMSGPFTKVVFGIFICWPNLCFLVVALDFVRKAIEVFCLLASSVFVVRFPSLPCISLLGLSNPHPAI